MERLAVKRYKARLLPGGNPGMRRLAAIGYSIGMLAWEAGMLVLETHPYTVFTLLGLDRRKYYSRTGSRHVVDAIAALIVAACLLEGNAEILAGEQGILVFPRENCRWEIVKVLENAGATCP